MRLGTQNKKIVRHYLIYPNKQKLQIKSLVSKYQIKIVLKLFCE